jgi:hypothetical protein
MSDSTLSDVALANVEALADESGGSSISWSCWSSLTSGAGVWLCGNPCSFHEDKGKGSGKDVCYSN